MISLADLVNVPSGGWLEGVETSSQPAGRGRCGDANGLRCPPTGISGVRQPGLLCPPTGSMSCPSSIGDIVGTTRQAAHQAMGIGKKPRAV